MVRMLLVSAALLLGASATSAQTSGAQGETPTVAPANVVGAPENARNYRQSTTGDPNRRVCRTQVATGSRLAGSKVCKTAREWEEQRVTSKAELDRMQTQRGLTGS
jgi:hypothetical protein